MRELRGKRVLITGAGRGIGRAQALAFAAEGAVVLATDLAEDVLEPLAAEIRDAGGEPHTYVLDVTDEERIHDLREQINAQHGPIDCLVNNAGVVFGGSFADVPLEKHLLTYQVNTLALMTMTHIFLPDLISRNEAHIVQIASASGYVGLPFGSTYASSKWAVIGFAESLRLELQQLGHEHVGTTTVCPSYINTGMFDGAAPPKMTRMLSPNGIARRVVTAVKKNRPMLIVPPLANLAPMMRGLLPLRMLDAVGGIFGMNTSMQQWRGHNQAKPEREPVSKHVGS